MVRTSLELRDVTVSFRRIRALDGLSFTVDDGAVLTVLGGPGFGGTTITRAVAGVLKVDSGRVRIRRLDVTNAPPGDRRVGLVPAGGGLLPHLSVEDNIAYRLQLRNEARPFVLDNRDKAIERLNLNPVRDLRPHQLAPEQRVRVALARASLGFPDVLAVDATAGADGTAGLRQVIADAALEPQTSVVLCTHDWSLVSDDDLVAVIADGAVGPHGRLGTLRSEAPDLATAQLVYADALAVVEAVAGDGELAVGDLRVPAPAGVEDGRRVLAALVPAALRLAPPSQGLRGRIRSVRAHGVRMTVEVALEAADNGAEPPLRGPLRLELTGMSYARAGDPVGVEVDPDRLLVFDADTRDAVTGPANR
jgi:ABC-type sugar transport system ATPase subunit